MVLFFLGGVLEVLRVPRVLRVLRVLGVLRVFGGFRFTVWDLG